MRTRHGAFLLALLCCLPGTAWASSAIPFMVLSLNLVAIVTVAVLAACLRPGWIGAVVALVVTMAVAVAAWSNPPFAEPEWYWLLAGFPFPLAAGGLVIFPFWRARVKRPPA